MLITSCNNSIKFAISIFPEMRIVLIFCLVFLTSCHSKKAGVHYPVIPEDKFVKLLVDYHLAEGVSYSEYYRQKTKNRKQMNVNDTILKNYGYTRAIFDNSVLYYSDDPEKFDAIYDKVIAILSRMQAQVQQRMVKKQAIEQKNFEIKHAEELKQKQFRIYIDKAKEQQEYVKRKIEELKRTKKKQIKFTKFK